MDRLRSNVNNAGRRLHNVAVGARGLLGRRRHNQIGLEPIIYIDNIPPQRGDNTGLLGRARSGTMDADYEYEGVQENNRRQERANNRGIIAGDYSNALRRLRQQ